MAVVLERAVLVAGATAAVLSLFDMTSAVVAFAAVAAVLGAFRLAAHPARWQMFPAYLAIAVICLVLAADPSAGWRIAGAAVALPLLALAAVASIGLPVPKLPPPDGRFGVGTVDAVEERQDGGPRRLFVKIWYPAEQDPARTRRDREPLWPEFRHAPGVPAALRLLTGYLRRARTHSVPGAPISPAAIGAPVVLYNHGLISIAAENTLLMESLAGHGYIVVSVRHLDQRAELDEVNAIPGPDAARAREIEGLLRGPLPRAEKARLSDELYRLSTGTAVLVDRRTADSRHVLDRLPSLLAAIPGHPAGTPPEGPSVAAVGLSLGGAVATELSKVDARCAAVVNMDGGLYGPHLDTPIGVPYLMLYSEPNAGGNDLARDAARATFQEVVMPGTKHMDFHDAAAVLPVLRWIGGLGKASGAEVVALKNQRIRRFLDQTLRAAAQPTT